MQSLLIYTLALPFLGLSLYIYLSLKHELRIVPQKITHDQIIDQKLGMLFFILCALCVTGFNFRPVERANSNMIGATPQLLWLSFYVAIPLCILQGIVLTRIKYKNAIIISIGMLPLLFVLNIGVLLTINGALDITKSNKYQVEVLNKRIFASGGRSGPTHILIVRNWKYPEGPVKLSPGKDFVKTTNIGDKLLVEIGSGLLGIEWVKSIQPTVANQPELTSPAPQTE